LVVIDTIFIAKQVTFSKKLNKSLILRLIRIIKLSINDKVTTRYEPIVPARLSLRMAASLPPTRPPEGENPSNSEELNAKPIKVVKLRRKMHPEIDFLKSSNKSLFLNTTKLV
jgi:hypothetical protein